MVARSTKIARRKSRFARLPIASSDGSDPVFAPLPEDWVRIARAYVHELSASNRDEIVRMIEGYFMFETSERSAPPVKNALHWLKDVSAKAENLAEALRTISNGEMDTAATYAADIVNRHVREKPSDDPNIVEAMMHRLYDFVACCDLAKRTLLDGAGRKTGFVEGRAWRGLVWKMTDYAKRQGCRTGAGKSNNVAPFVAFFRELHQTLPQEFRPHHMTDDGLAQAIGVARREVKRALALHET